MRDCSISKRFTGEETRRAIVSAGESVVFDNELAAKTRAPRRARSKSKGAR